MLSNSLPAYGAPIRAFDALLADNVAVQTLEDLARPADLEADGTGEVLAVHAVGGGAVKTRVGFAMCMYDILLRWFRKLKKNRGSITGWTKIIFVYFKLGKAWKGFFSQLYL